MMCVCICEERETNKMSKISYIEDRILKKLLQSKTSLSPTCAATEVVQQDIHIRIKWEMIALYFLKKTVWLAVKINQL